MHGAEKLCVINRDYRKEKFGEIISQAKEGDIAALEELIRRIQKHVFVMFGYLTVKRQDISDLTQDVLIKTAKSIKNLKEPKYFKSWLNHIVTNTYYDFLKQHKNDSKVEADEDKLMELKDKIGCEPGERCLFAEMDKVIKAALFSLPHSLRIVIILREYEGLSYEEISKLTNTAQGTVKSRIARARMKLQQQLKEFI